MMKPMFRAVRAQAPNVPVLTLRLLTYVPVLTLLLFLAGPVGAQQAFQGTGSPGSAPALPPGITPQQAEAAGQAVRSGAEIPPEVQRILESRPDLKDQLPAEFREKFEETPESGRTEDEAARKLAVTQGAPPHVLPYDWRTSVYVRSLFAKRLDGPEIRTLSHFGHEIFDGRGAAILENMPVAPGYVIGPGDEVVVKLWGRMEGTYRMPVDRDGKIYFPKIGSLYVAGKTFDEMKDFIRKRVAAIAQVSSDVSLGQMKGIRVSVIGEVRSPGWYNASSLHTALQVLSLAGGVKDIGSLRRIEIRRGGKTVETIDLYDFLLMGDTRADTRLLQGDTIFVPVVGNLVALAGEVRRPAIYELKGEKTLIDLVRMAGGFSPMAYKRRVQVERLESHFARIVLDADAEDLEKNGTAFDLADGDIVRVLPIVYADINAVTLEGNVVRPGRYELKPGMTVKSLLPDERHFLQETWFDYALLTRLVPPDMHKEAVPVNLRAIVLEKNGEADILLEPYDTLTVFPRTAFRGSRKATISGEVRLARAPAERTYAPDTLLLPLPNPGGPRSGGNVASPDNAFLPESGQPGNDRQDNTARSGAAPDNTVLEFEITKGMRVADLVRMAGDVTLSASLERAEIVRIREDHSFHTIYFHLGKALAGDPSENVLLEDEDRVRIHSVWETRYRKTVTVSGDVNAPGEYILTEGMCLSDLVFKAGGFVESAYLNEAELVRREITPEGDLVKTETLVVHPGRFMNGERDADVALRRFDLLVIRGIPEWAEKIHVTLAGEVRFPGVYAARKGEHLGSVIDRAGGFTSDAYLEAARFTRVSTQETQQEAIDRMIEDLEIEVAQRAQEVTGALDREDIEANKMALEARRSLIAQLKKARAQGRVIIHLAQAEALKGTDADILLEDGDRLEVPKKTNVVNVVGRVYNPTGVVFDPGNDRLGYYLNKVGGPTESADRKHIFLVKADGSVVSRDTMTGGFLSRKSIDSAQVRPGDSVVVPEKLVKTRAMKDFKDITQILYQIAVTAGVLIVAF